MNMKRLFDEFVDDRTHRVRVSKETLANYHTAWGIHFEIEEQIKADVLRAKLADGSAAFWNENIGGRWFRRDLG